MNVYMPGLTWDCTCGAVNDAVDSSCESCGRPPGDVGAPSVVRRALPFSAAGSGPRAGTAVANGTTLLSAGWVTPPTLTPDTALTSPDWRDPGALEAPDVELPVAPGTYGDPGGNRTATRSVPKRVSRPVGAARPNLLDDPEPEPAPVRPVRRRPGVFSFGFLLVVLALIAAVTVVTMFVSRSGNSKPPDPNQVTTASAP